jgi:hypothetical protein
VTMPPSTPRRPRSLILGTCLGVVGLAGLAVAVLSPWHLPGIGIALLGLMAGATLLSNAARIADQLTSLVGKSVRIEVWGQPIEPTGAFQVQSVRALGAGLHIFLRSPLAKSPQDLKIAQPRAAQVTATQLTIAGAAYVSLAGTKLRRNGDRPALNVAWPTA